MAQETRSAAVAFTEPPVRSVFLTVNFEPVAGLQVSHFSAFRERVAAQFPETAEMPPLRHLNREDSEAQILPLDQAWPFPYVLYTSEDEQGGVAFQNDRFIRSWAFNNTGSGQSEYLGFEALYESLSTLFSDFMQTVRDRLNHDIVVTGCQASYTNRLPDMTDANLLVGLASQWQSGPIEGPGLKSRYAGLRLHLCDEDELEGCSINLAMDRDSDGTDLTIEVTYSLKDDGSVHSDLGGLRHAHDHLIDTFLTFTGEEMQTTWGRL